MTKHGKQLLVIIILVFCNVADITAQSHGRLRKAAVELRIGNSALSKPKVTGGGTASSFVRDDVMGGTDMFMLAVFDFEYYIPSSRFSVKAAIEIENAGESFIDEYESAFAGITLGELMLGGRYYIARPTSFIQPYAGLDVYLNGSYRKQEFKKSGTSPEGYNYNTSGYVRGPLVSVGPIVGTDIYITKSFAIQLELGYRIGIDSRIKSQTIYGPANDIYNTKGNMNRLVFCIGYKFTFPFHDFHKCDTPFRGLANRIFSKKK